MATNSPEQCKKLMYKILYVLAYFNIKKLKMLSMSLVAIINTKAIFLN